MHFLATAVAVAALAAAPCAWDSDPPEASALPAIFAGTPARAAGVLMRQDKALFPTISGAARASELSIR